MTTLTASLQAALDGVTFNDVVASGSFISSTGPVLLKQVTNPPAGAALQINNTATSGGFDIWVVAN